MNSLFHEEKRDIASISLAKATSDALTWGSVINAVGEKVIFYHIFIFWLLLHRNRNWAKGVNKAVPI